MKTFLSIIFCLCTNNLISQNQYISLNSLEKMIQGDWKDYYEKMEDIGYEFDSENSEEIDDHLNIQFKYKNRKSKNFIEIDYIIFNKKYYEERNKYRPSRRIAITSFDKKYIDKIKTEIKTNYNLIKPGIYRKNYLSTKYSKNNFYLFTEYMIFIDVNL